MPVQTIPARPDLTDYTFQVELDGGLYDLDILYNSRERLWYGTLRDVNGVDILSGFKMTLGTPVTRLLTDRRRPPGEIVLFDTTGEGIDAGDQELGDRVLVLYTELEDISG